MIPPFKIPDSFEEFSRMTQAELQQMRESMNKAHELHTQIMTTIEQQLTEIITTLEGGTMPDLDTICHHAERLIDERTKNETYSWRGTPILSVTHSVTLTRLV
jgi:chromatin segregation and condensation protein Rec8/ScpA/Scc1 (kleisin family)